MDLPSIDHEYSPRSDRFTHSDYFVRNSLAYLYASQQACLEAKTPAEILSWRVFMIDTISPQGIGAVGLIFDGKTPIPYGKS